MALANFAPHGLVASPEHRTRRLARPWYWRRYLAFRVCQGIPVLGPTVPDVLHRSHRQSVLCHSPQVAAVKPLWQFDVPFIGGGHQVSLADLDAQLKELFTAPIRGSFEGRSILAPGTLLNRDGYVIEDDGGPPRQWRRIV